jgi:iron complex outermembrane receptor protein/vitamin B12 transporter
MKLRLLFLFCVTAMTLSSANGALAQPPTSAGRLKGQVVDINGSGVSRARVTLRRGSGFVAREQTTDSEGRFEFEGLNHEAFLLFAEADGLTQNGGAHAVRLDQGPVGEVRIEMTLTAIHDGIVVTERRTETQTSDAMSSVLVVPDTDIARTQRSHVLDTLRGSPGVSVMQSGRRGGVTSLFVRGGESDYTKVFIDGIPINDAGGAFDLSDLTTDNADRVELVRGPQSALYGSDSMSGVLQFVTRRGMTATPSFDLSSEGGSFGFNRTWASLGGVIGKLDYSGSFSYLGTNGRDRNDDYLNRTASANLGYRFTERTQLRVTARNENAGLGVAGATGRYYPDPDERSRRRRIATGARFDDQTSTYWHQSFSFVYDESNQSSFDPVAQDLTKPNTPPDTSFAFNDFVSFFTNHQKRTGVRYQTDLILPGANLLSAGFDYDHERAVFINGFDGRNRVDPSRSNLGFYIQNQVTWFSRWSVSAGLRVEHNTAETPQSLVLVLKQLGSAAVTGDVGFGTRFAPKLSTAFLLHTTNGQEVFGNTRLRASYGEGIKAPTLVEAFSPSPFFLGNPGLKAERARSFDVGLEQNIMGERMRFEVTYFESHFRDQIAFVGDPATFGGPITLPDGRLTNFVNFDRARVRGIELSGAVRPIRQLSFSGNYTFLNSKQTAAADVIDFNTGTLVPNPEVGLTLLRRPKHSGSFNAAWMGERFDLNLQGFIVGERRDVDPVTFSRLASNKGYARVDLAGAYRVTHQLSFFARAENLFNRNYEEILGYPAYRLTFSAGLKLSLGGR